MTVLSLSPTGIIPPLRNDDDWCQSTAYTVPDSGRRRSHSGALQPSPVPRNRWIRTRNPLPSPMCLTDRTRLEVTFLLSFVAEIFTGISGSRMINDRERPYVLWSVDCASVSSKFSPSVSSSPSSSPSPFSSSPSPLPVLSHPRHHYLRWPRPSLPRSPAASQSATQIQDQGPSNHFPSLPALGSSLLPFPSCDHMNSLIR